MGVNQQRYRQLQYDPERILQSRELNWVQEMAQGVALGATGGGGSPVSGQLQSLYRQGAMMNVTVTVSGLTVTLSATNPSYPMLVFVRDRWETFPTVNDKVADHLSVTVGANAVIHLQSTETVIYLSWQLYTQTGGPLGTDPSLSDALTGAATANAGELQLALNTASAVGTVGPAGYYYGNVDNPGGTPLAVNTSLISALTFTNNGTTLTYIPQDNIISTALGSATTSGFVSIDPAYGGSGSKVVATNDNRLGAAIISVANGLVCDATVRTPLPAGGTNSNSTPVYKLPVDGGTDIGGISAAKIILLATTQTLEAGWNWLYAAYNSLSAAFAAHYTAQLGLSNTHPIPTPAQVGAAPSSHVGQPLGTSGSAQAAISHPGVINTTTGGFQVNQSATGAALDPAYGVFTSGTDIASLNHDGDIYSALAAALTVSGVSAPATTTGNLGLISTMAKVLSQHVNQNASSGNFNPHNLTATQLGLTFPTSLTTNGYIIIPGTGGLIIQWGTTSYFPASYPGDNSQISADFAIPFPHAVFTMVASPNNFSVQVGGEPEPNWPMITVVNNLSLTGYTITANTTNQGGLFILANTLKAYWIAIGY